MCWSGWREVRNQAVSYTHLDVYKRQEGNLYLDSTIIVDMAYKVLNAGFPTDTVRRGQIKLAGNELVMKDKILEADGTAIYLKAYREAEKEATYHLVRLLRSPAVSYTHLPGYAGFSIGYI